MTVVTSITETRTPPSRGAPSCPDLLRVASPQLSLSFFLVPSFSVPSVFFIVFFFLILIFFNFS